MQISIQLTLVISTSLISNNRLSRSENLIPALTWKSNNRWKYCGKEEKLLPRSNFSSFPQYFQYISNFKSPITYKFVKCGCSNYVFLKSANLICRSTDISKFFRESLGIRDNESRLYIPTLAGCMGKPTEDIKISLNASLKRSPKGVFPTKKNWNKNFHFKICK